MTNEELIKRARKDAEGFEGSGALDELGYSPKSLTKVTLVDAVLVCLPEPACAALTGRKFDSCE